MAVLRKFQNGVKMVAFAMLVVIMLNILSSIFIPKQVNSNAKYEAEIADMGAFYEESEKSIDVVFLGSSHIYSAISPMEMWNEYGIAGYNCTSSSQCAYKSYHYLIEIFKHQSPKVVVFDLMSLFIDETIDEISNRSALNHMKFSLNFLETTYHSLNPENGETMESYIFPVLRYHSRWEELTRRDFSIWNQRDVAKRYDMRWGVVQNVKLERAKFSYLDEPPTDEAAPVVENSAKYIRKMVDLCKENDAEMVFIKTPVTGYTRKTLNAMQKFSDECGVKLIDYNRKWDELGWDYTTDFMDTVHLNTKGARKLSKSLGHTLVTEYGVKNHKDDKAYKQWNEDYKIYEAQVAAKELQNCTELSRYMELCKDKGYVLMYAGNVDNIDDNVRKQLQILPLEKGKIQYGIIDNKNENKSLHYAGNGSFRYDIGEVRCEISTEGGYKIRFLGEELINKEEGLVLVAFDRKLGLAADVVKISTGKIVRE